MRLEASGANQAISMEEEPMFKTRTALIALVAMLALMPSALAVPTITMLTPTEGQTFSPATSSSISAAGKVLFNTPAPTSQAYYLRRTACADDKRLSTVQGAETTSCADNSSDTPANEVTRTAAIWAAAGGVPFTFDASRAITGQMVLSSFQEPNHAGAGQTVIEIALSGITGGSQESLGSTSVEYVALPGQAYTTQWSITPPATADKQDFTSFTMAITIRGMHVLHGYIRPNESRLTLPTYTASFDRRVEVRLGTGPFVEVLVTPDFASWSVQLPMPPAGGYPLQARARQGDTVSAVATRNIIVSS